MTNHLLEAIEINKIRKMLYAKLTSNRSLKISRTLTYAERLSLPTSYIIDNLAKYWIKNGVPVMAHEFVPMKDVPAFKESFDNEDGLAAKLPTLDTLKIQKECNKLLKDFNYEGLAQYVDKTLKQMSMFSKHFCMVRHILESIRRGANLLPIHLKYSEEANLKSPERVCRYLLKSQIYLIHSSRLIDIWAYPLQKSGVPIIYQDVPYISPMPKSYESF